MKFLAILFALATALAAATSFAEVADPVSCVKAAVNEANVLAPYKNFPKSDTQSELRIEELAIQLCGRASKAYDPIACYKSTVKDADFLPIHKRYFGSDSVGELHVAELALKLCGSNH